MDEGVAHGAHLAPAVREVPEAELRGGVLELLAGEHREQPTDALADGTLAVEDGLADAGVSAARSHDPVEDVLEQRLEEGRDEDDHDLGFAVGVVAPYARVELPQPLGREHAPLAGRGAAERARLGAVAERGVRREEPARRALPVAGCLRLRLRLASGCPWNVPLTCLGFIRRL